MKNINPQKIYQETHETGLKAMVKCNPIPMKCVNAKKMKMKMKMKKEGDYYF